MTNYPRDEFDRVPENSARHGVHRASLEVASRSLVPLMIFGVAALCVGLLAFLIVPKFSGHEMAAIPPASQSATAPATPHSKQPATTKAPSAAPSTAPAPTPSAAPAATVDKSTAVVVFNATGIGGLAARYSGQLAANGWTVAQTGNWSGSPQGISSIIYNGAAQKANAEALGRLLNISTLLDSAEMGVPLTIILGPGA
ncbi:MULTISPECIES: LytR C-terminal domain-containing protein [unclassified Arthrobacter]|uniref:LytR C-terminal domain-containing protein n=1 Tax=unclassified Arthrobacter TaxID=235627 RepID=UPI00159E5B21|nr:MULTISPECIES: LytR C-terminal domain-containing protein [unclassified Arthrobacter]MCQ9165892.1 LytR C-terminal domain-containing protein [Arthrobacter sp. STN4]NVM99069.1 LytR C-terminal domain-containing protein [Arthrobacter sp. SDTb3-6]